VTLQQHLAPAAASSCSKKYIGTKKYNGTLSSMIGLCAMPIEEEIPK
jgi:hypothetical protein